LEKTSVFQAIDWDRKEGISTKNFFAKLIKGSTTRDAQPDAGLDDIASLDSKPSFGATIREINQSLHGLDVRELWRDGYSDKQIRNLMMDEYNVMELYKKEPLGKNRSPKGNEILAAKKKH